MKRNRPWLITATLLFLLALNAPAQAPKGQKTVKKTTEQKSTKKPVVKKAPAVKQTDAVQDEKKVREIVAFLEFVLNTLGSSGTPTRDKEVLITDSYSKIFRDSKVQIEDDLDEEREVITNKDVVAYLKDVDFFFNEVRFEFTIEEIKSGVNASGKIFYKVSLKRNLKGTTTDGKSVNNTKPRFIEVNYNPEDQDLKIASIYTNEFNEKDVLTHWWKQLSFEWQSIFRKKLKLTADSLALGDIKNIAAITELDLSGNTFIQTLEPLGQLINLRSLNLSRTTVTDLAPIRNLTELVDVDISHTKILDLSPLKYSDKLEKLKVDHTEVSDISIIQKMPMLHYLDASATPVADFTPIATTPELLQLNLEGSAISDLSPLGNLAQLTELNISSTSIKDVSSLKGLTALGTLDLDSTRIANIESLGGLEKLKVLHANHTLISDLKPLQKLPQLEKIYCDQTPITREVADAFMAANPKVLVVFDSRDLKVWWDTLTPEWQVVLGKAASIGAAPSKEELAKVTSVDSINLGENGHMYNLEPLRKLQKLQVIIANKTSIKDLSPLQDHTGIRYLDISNTEVSDLSVVSRFTKLNVLRADKTKIEDLDPLNGLKGLEKLYVDQTPIHDIIVQEFLLKNSTCLVVHKTIHLNRWWSMISPEWKEVFRKQMAPDTSATRENLHKLVERESLQFKEAPVRDLSALSEFLRLKELDFSGTSITDISLPPNISSLKSLHATNSPIQKIESLQNLNTLEDLDISNTPTDDLKVIGSLGNLQKLNCSGTHIKKLDPLENLQHLEFLDCSNSRVTNLDPLLHLPVKTLKCYNTKISSREVESFKKKKPDCNVVYYR